MQSRTDPPVAEADGHAGEDFHLTHRQTEPVASRGRARTARDAAHAFATHTLSQYSGSRCGAETIEDLQSGEFCIGVAIGQRTCLLIRATESRPLFGGSLPVAGHLQGE